jgi:tetratricopeptide (TPR) repeat protein
MVRVGYDCRMVDHLRLEFETLEGEAFESPPLSAGALRLALETEGLFEALLGAGLEATERGGAHRIALADLLRAADRLDAGRDGVATLRVLLQEAPDQAIARAIVVLERPPPVRHLSLLQNPPPRSLGELLIELESGDHGQVDGALYGLQAVTPETPDQREGLSRALGPHLRDVRTRGAACKVAGAIALTELGELLERLLRQANTLPNRLSILGALIQLGRDDGALRTLRSMLIYGPKENHGAVVDLLVEVARPRNLQSLRALVRLLQPIERIMLSALLYAQGDLSAYTAISRGMEKMGPSTPKAVVTRVLASVKLANSRRFIPLLRTYEAREERPWFTARSQAIVRHLERDGRKEPTCPELLAEIEHAIGSGDAERAMVLLDQLTVLEPSNARALYMKASLLKDEDRLDDALKCATAAVAAEPREWQLHRLRGSLQWDLGRAEAALEAYDTALELNPTDPFAWYYKGYVLYRMREPAQALPCLDRSLSLRPDEAAVLNHKAFCLENLERIDEAISCYRKSLRHRPADMATRDHLAAALGTAGRLPEALAIVEVTLKVEPRRVRSLERRAEILRAMKRWRPADMAYGDLLREAPDHFSAWVSRGKINHRLGALDLAIDCLRHAVRIRPESVPARNVLARYLDEQREG